VVIAIAIVRLHNIFAVVMLTGIYSLVAALLFVVLDAVDVALTEAAVGAGISTLLMLATLGAVGHESAPPRRFLLLPLLVVVVTGIALLSATADMPPFTDPAGPAHTHVAPRYIQESPSEIGIPNMVTSVLASYRGYDTFGEVVVIFTAGIGVLLLLGGRRRRDLEGE
jgi:multicomponent Na+:H+ antiporter subunit B